MLEHTIAYADLAEMWQNVTHKGASVMPRQRVAIEALNGLDESFTGCSVADMDGWIDRGYLRPGMDVKPAANTRPRRKLRFDEEGEIQVDMALSGHDTPFLNWGKRKRTPGLKLKVELAVRATTPAQVLTDYAQWLASLVAGMQAKGFDLEIDVVSRAQQVTTTRDRVDVGIRVKQFGKRSDLKSWGAILSPGGFRRLVFLSRIIAADANGKIATGGFGGSFGPDWGLSFDQNTRTLTIRCAAATTRFPREEMDAQLAALKI